MYRPKRGEKYDPEGNHTYMVYKDKTTKKIYAIQTTHLYEKKKEKKIENGTLMVAKLPKIKYPSGIHKQIYKTDINGNPIDLKRVNAINCDGGNKSVYVPSKLSKKVLKFVR